MISLDKKGLTSVLKNYKEKHGLVDDFSFSYNDINDITMDKAQYYNSQSDLVLDFELRSEFTSLNIWTKTVDINH